MHIGESDGLKRFGAGAAFCLSLAAIGFSTAPASAELFSPGVRAYFQNVRSSTHQARKRHNTKHKDVKIEKQKVPHGPVHVIVSIGRQRAILYAGGVRVAEGPISTGVPGHPTPLGVFSVIQKSRHHRSNIYSGAPMPYMQRITWSGVALHQGPLPGYPASHGCIRLTQAFAAKLWVTSKLGARVIVTRDEIAPASIESGRLFNPKKPPEVPAENTALPTQPPAPILAATTATIVDDAGTPEIIKQPEAPKPVAEAPKPKGPVEVFVSRKSAKVYVRQGFIPLFEAPVTIAEPDKPWGTHVFTVMDIKDDEAEWSALTIPSGYAHRPDRHSRKLSAKEIERREKRATDIANAPSAAEALARFELSQGIVDLVSEMLIPGSSLIVSDNAMSDETGEYTGFIVKTH